MTTDASTIEVLLEDGPRRLPVGSTVADLIHTLALPLQRTTVAVNGSHVPRAQWMSHRLDHVHKVLFVQPIVGG
jgi:thiamine biosynthesis protein ThiS